MKFETTSALLALVGVASARPDVLRRGLATPSRLPPRAGALTHFRREVPQEHSHEKILTSVRTSLNLDNVDQVQDVVFALLGNAAAATGAGKVTNPDCLQQRVADQAFTNSKAAGDVDGQANALMFRCLERNTGSVGQASVLCTETAANAEIAALQQHQDPASTGAAALNKQIVLDLAVQLAAIGADPQLALETGTFAPGKIGDNTGAGNTCDDPNDKEGCIFSLNLLVEDASAAEITAAVSAGGVGSGSAVVNGTDGCATVVDSGAAKNGTAAEDTAGDAATATPTTAAGNDVNAFTGTVGAAPVPVISSVSARPFSVNGDTFINIGAAVQRACDVQKNKCANAANSGGGGSVSDCDAQQQQCIAANQRRRRRGHGRVLAY